MDQNRRITMMKMKFKYMQTKIMITFFIMTRVEKIYCVLEDGAFIMAWDAIGDYWLCLEAVLCIGSKENVRFSQ